MRKVTLEILIAPIFKKWGFIPVMDLQAQLNVVK